LERAEQIANGESARQSLKNGRGDNTDGIDEDGAKTTRKILHRL
jgi:hypothetical protein